MWTAYSTEKDKFKDYYNCVICIKIIKGYDGCKVPACRHPGPCCFKVVIVKQCLIPCIFLQILCVMTSAH